MIGLSVINSGGMSESRIEAAASAGLKAVSVADSPVDE